MTVFREHLAEWLAARVGLRVVGAVAGPDAARAAGAGRPAVVLVDDRACTRELVDGLRQSYAPVKVVAIGVDEGDEAVLACAAAGVDGFVPGEASEGELLGAVARALRGELVCSPRAAALLLREAGNGGRSGNGAGDLGLTPRELEVVACFDEGLRNKQIGRELGIAPNTVKKHGHSILKKLGVGSRGAAAALVRGHLGRSGGARPTDAPLEAG